MSLSKKRMAVAEDVIARIKMKQFIPETGVFCEMDGMYMKRNEFKTKAEEKITEVCDIVNAQKKCNVCAKGGLFMSLIGYVDNFSINGMSNNTRLQVRLNGREMKTLSRIFSPKQLSMIETAFEGKTFGWNMTLTEDEEKKCVKFFEKYDWIAHGSSKRLIAICKNIVKNNGIFIP